MNDRFVYHYIIESMASIWLNVYLSNSGQLPKEILKRKTNLYKIEKVCF